MAYEIPGFSYTLVSVADLSASQFRFVDVNNAGKAVVPSLGGPVVGVRNNKPRANEEATVVGTGISIVEAGAAITVGAYVTTDATGRVITAATGHQIHGRALETASGAGVFVAVLLLPAARVV
jgi:hypothetical protein